MSTVTAILSYLQEQLATHARLDSRPPQIIVTALPQSLGTIFLLRLQRQLSSHVHSNSSPFMSTGVYLLLCEEWKKPLFRP